MEHPSVTLVRAPNLGPMTLDGTNSYVLRAPGASGCVVVDPGPLDEGHLDALVAHGPIELILLTHHHHDHSDAVDALHERTGAPVRAVDAAWCRAAEPVVDGERVEAAGLRLVVLATPGHTADSLCLLLPDEGERGAVLTGDTVLGSGTTIIADPDGALGPYLDTLERLRDLGAPGPVAVLPGHGPELPDLRAICEAYLAHREQRLGQVRAALAEIGSDASAEAVTDAVYGDVDPAVRFAAEASVRAQLAYLRG